MRISDWSSDVCSSDLILPAASDVTETGWETKWMAMNAALDTYDCAPSEISQDVEDVLGEAYLKAQQVFMDSPAYDPRALAAKILHMWRGPDQRMDRPEDRLLASFLADAQRVLQSDHCEGRLDRKSMGSG